MAGLNTTPHTENENGNTQSHDIESSTQLDHAVSEDTNTTDDNNTNVKKGYSIKVNSIQDDIKKQSVRTENRAVETEW